MTDPVIDPARLDANWRGIVAELDAPRPTWLERLLLRAHIPATVTRVVVATPALRRAWYLALVIVVVVGLGAARPDEPDTLFTLLVLAPLVPVLGVAMAYGPAADPAHEVHLATPVRGLRLIAIRATTVLVVAVLAIGLLSLMSPETRPMAAAWLLPSLALTSGTLAAMTVFQPRLACAIVGGIWFAGVLGSRVVTADDLAAFRPPAQLGALVVAVACVVIAVRRRDTFDRLMVSS